MGVYIVDYEGNKPCLLYTSDDETYDNHRHNRDEEAYAYPHQTFRTDYRLEEPVSYTHLDVYKRQS